MRFLALLVCLVAACESGDGGSHEVGGGPAPIAGSGGAMGAVPGDDGGDAARVTDAEIVCDSMSCQALDASDACRAGACGDLGARDAGRTPDSDAGREVDARPRLGDASADAAPLADAGRASDASAPDDVSAPDDAGPVPDPVDAVRVDAAVGECGPCGGDCEGACDRENASTCSGPADRQVCAADPERPACLRWTTPIRCAEGRDCDGDRCRGPCLPLSVVLLVDRSASMAGARWDAVGRAVTALGRLPGGHAWAIRAFPAVDDECGAAPAGPFTAAPGDALRTVPSPTDQRRADPSAGLAGLAGAWAEAAEGRAVFLVTDGGEPCDGGDPLPAARALRQAGATLHVFAMGPGAGDDTLDQLAAAGGTRAAVRVRADDDLPGALLEAVADLDGCSCLPEATRCAGGLREACDARGVRWVPDGEACPDLDFRGVRRGLPIADLDAAGFRRCLQVPYASRVDWAQVVDGCDGQILVVGCRPNGARTLTVAAMGDRGTVLAGTGAETQQHRGATWYYDPAGSFGFAPAGADVDRRPCDQSRDDDDRLCWRLDGAALAPGQRCADRLDLDNPRLDGNAWERVLYTR